MLRKRAWGPVAAVDRARLRRVRVGVAGPRAHDAELEAAGGMELEGVGTGLGLALPAPGELSPPREAGWPRLHTEAAVRVPREPD